MDFTSWVENYQVPRDILGFTNVGEILHVGKIVLALELRL